MISRNKSKMIEKLEEIKKSAPHEIKTRYVVADFS
jgi:hypothetical protein